jgi:hypothetical protein
MTDDEIDAFILRYTDHLFLYSKLAGRQIAGLTRKSYVRYLVDEGRDEQEMDELVHESLIRLIRSERIFPVSIRAFGPKMDITTPDRLVMWKSVLRGETKYERDITRTYSEETTEDIDIWEGRRDTVL